MDGPTLQQLEVFRVVAETGSFSAAARQLERAQSAVSYTIAALEGELGLALFDREGHKPALTDAGRVLLQEARAVTGQVERLLGRARSLRQKVEPELSMVVDVMFPHAALIEALAVMTTAFPEVSVRIRSERLGGVAEVVRRREAHIGICPAIDGMSEGLDHRPAGTIELVPVVAASHPLASATALTGEHLAAHVQIVLSNRPADGPDRGVLSPRTWRTGDLPLRHAMVRAGFGWANMPRHLVQEDLQAGRLVPLDFASKTALRQLPMVAVTQRSSPPGPAGRCLLEALSRQLTG